MTDYPQTVTIRVPFAIRKRGGRKLVIAPNGTETGVPSRHRVDNSMVKALARAFRWRKLLDTCVYGSIEEMAAAEKINTTYVSRLLRMTLLAPNIVEAILDGRQPAEVTLAGLMRPFAVVWQEQRLPIGAACVRSTVAAGQAVTGQSAYSAMICRAPEQR